MKSLFKTLGSIAVCSVLVACGGSGSGTPDRQALGLVDIDNSTGSEVADDASQFGDSASILGEPAISAAVQLSDAAAIGGEQSALLGGEPDIIGTLDLNITNASVSVTDSGLAFTFSVLSDSGSVPFDNLSIALEVAASGSFADSYALPLYDIRESEESNTLQLTARTTAVELPAGTYDARLVVNPNWQYHFDISPADHNHSSSYRYITESDYSNNASGVFQVEGGSSNVCVEDVYENNDSIGFSTPIAPSTRIEASLCLDDVDFYSVVLPESQVASLTFAYTDEETNPNPATRYVVLDSGFNRITEPTVAREANRILISAADAGQYYLALFGKRSSYRLTRASLDVGFLDDVVHDSLFHTQTIVGPQSWFYGDITLHRLAFTEAMLRDQVVNCGRISTQYSDERPVAYVTPDHFAEVHEFRFLSEGGYLVDGERHNGWHIQDGDISHADWYEHSYPGYAERVDVNSWRYWSQDGLGYVDCELEVNR